MTPNALAIPTPQTAVEISESWAGLPADVRKRRAADASQNGDRAQLRSLLAAYVVLYGRRGSDTSPRTHEVYWRGAELFLAWCENPGAVKPHQAGEAEARRFLASLTGRAPKSRQVYLTGARTFVAALRWTGLGAGDPFERVSVRESTTPVGLANPYSPRELRKLLAKADPRERVLVLLAADGGLRLAEVVALTWAQVDLQRRRVSVLGKGGVFATVSITDQLAKALRGLRRTTEAVLPIGRRRLQRTIKRLCERAGVKARGYHQLRHSCGKEIYFETGDILAVQRHLRHSSVRTSEIYAHLAEVNYLKAIAALDRAAAKPARR